MAFGSNVPSTGTTYSQLVNDEPTNVVICTPVYSDGPGTLKMALGDGSAKSKGIGVVIDVAIKPGASGNVLRVGVATATTTQWDTVCGTSGGLAYGTLYYLSATGAGALTTDASSGVPVIFGLAPTVGAIVTVMSAGGTTKVQNLSVVGTATVNHIDLAANILPTIGPEMNYWGFRGSWLLGVDVANAPTSRDFVITGVRGNFSFPDGATTNGSPTLTSATGANFVTAMIGAGVSGPGIQTGATITAVASLTSCTMSLAATATGAALEIAVTHNTVQDLLYWKHRGGLSPTLGLGLTPPDGTARLQVAAQDSEPTMGTARLRVGPAQTANALTTHDSGPVDRWWVDSSFYMSGAHGNGVAVCIQADQANNRPLMFMDKTKSAAYGFSYPGGNSLRMSYISGGFDILDFHSDGALQHLSTKLGFFATPAVTRQTITGSRGGNVALASLLTALATMGLITDSTTP